MTKADKEAAQLDPDVEKYIEQVANPGRREDT